MNTKFNFESVKFFTSPPSTDGFLWKTLSLDKNMQMEQTKEIMKKCVRISMDLILATK